MVAQAQRAFRVAPVSLEDLADITETRVMLECSALRHSIALGDAHLHGAPLAVWSEPGRGTHFVLTLPRGRGIVEPDAGLDTM